jgi:anti-anti-sigma factor
VFHALATTENVTVVRITSEILNAENLQAAVERLGERGPGTVHLDLSSVQLPTAEGLGALIALGKQLRARGGALVLVNVPADVCEVLALTRLDEVLELRPG